MLQMDLMDLIDASNHFLEANKMVYEALATLDYDDMLNQIEGDRKAKEEKARQKKKWDDCMNVKGVKAR